MKAYIQFARKEWPLLGFGFLCVFFGNVGQSFFVGVYGDSIRAELDISATQYGLLYSLATLASGATLMMVGGWIDRASLARFVYFLAAGLTLAAISFYFGVSTLLVLLSFYLIRLFGQGLLPHTGMTSMARYFDHHRGKAISLASSGVPVGEIILPAIAVMLISWLGWRESWLVLGGVVPLVFLPLALFFLSRPAARQKIKEFDTAHVNGADLGRGLKGARRALLCDRRFWLLLPALLTPPFVVTGVLIHQGFVIEGKSWSAEWFAHCFIIYGLVHWAASLLAGWLVDRFSAVALLSIYTLPVSLSMLLLATTGGLASTIWVLSLIALSIGLGGPISGALWAEVYGAERIGTIRSVVVTFIIWSTSVSPLVLGWCIDQHWRVESIALYTAIGSFLFALAARFSYKMAPAPDPD